MASARATLKENSVGSQVFDLGEITDITITYTSNVMATPILIMGYAKSFAMDDGGVWANVKISFERVSPIPANNSSSDSTKWSNSYWNKKLKASLNKWQAGHNGYVLTITSPDEDLFPSLSFVGFITSFPFSQSASRLRKGTIDFNVGRLTTS